METLKEIVIDVLILVAGIVIITAEGAYNNAKGLSCGRTETTQTHP